MSNYYKVSMMDQSGTAMQIILKKMDIDGKVSWSSWTKVNGKLTFGRLEMDESDLDQLLRLVLEATQLERHIPNDEDREMIKDFDI